MRSVLLLCLVVFLSLFTGCSEQSTANPPAADYLANGTPASDFVIIPGQRVGPITPSATKADLIRIYGVENVQDGGFYIAEGACEPGTILFPNDPIKRVEITWGDTKQQAYPTQIQWMEEKTVWHTPEGITMGTSAKKLLELNEGPFTVGGFSWDYGGYISSWRGGKLEKALDDPGFSVRLDITGEIPETTDDIFGDRQVQSEQLAGFEESVTVSRLILMFSENTQKFPYTGEEQMPCDEIPSP